MSLKFYNTLTRKKEQFKPLHKSWVGLYTCGPTVYNYVHIGNFRTYIFQDVLRRTLEKKYHVKHIMNITDVDDKTIKASETAGKTLKVFTKEYERVFKDDLKKLNIKFPTRFTRATEHIPDMVATIAQLLKKGFAYEKDGSVYFDISKFKNYGKLAHLDTKGLKAGARVESDEYTKDEMRDFVLWKAEKSGEPSWPSPFGRGRPGWHIECSVMSTKYLGQPFDLHTAAVDLIFPHHENEIAQAEAEAGKEFVRHWMHGEHLLVEGQKMSKSLGNIFTLRDIEKNGFNPLAFRYLVLTSGYRSKLNFTWESLEAAQNSLERLYKFASVLSRRNLYSTNYYRGFASIVKKRFEEALFDDLNTPKALAVAWSLVSDYNKDPSKYSPKEILTLLYDFDTVFNLGLKNVKKEKIPEKIRKLVEKREEHRVKKQWKKADTIRDEITKRGWVVEDTAGGPRTRRI